MESLSEQTFFQLMKIKTFTANQNQLTLKSLKLKLTCSQTEIQHPVSKTWIICDQMWSRVFDIHISDTKTIYLCTYRHTCLHTLHFDFQARLGSTSSLATLSSLSQAGAQDLATPTPCALLWCLEHNLMNCKAHIYFHMQTAVHPPIKIFKFQKQTCGFVHMP